MTVSKSIYRNFNYMIVIIFWRRFHVPLKRMCILPLSWSFLVVRQKTKDRITSIQVKVPDRKKCGINVTLSKRNDKILINIQSTRTEIDLQMSMSQLETCRKDEVCLLSLTWVYNQSSEPRLVSSLNWGVSHFPNDWQLAPNRHTSAPSSPILNTFLYTFPR